MFLLVRRCVKFLNWLRRLKVMVTLQGHVLHPSICVCSISPDPFGRLQLDLTQMFLSVSYCAELITRLCKLNVKVTLQGHVIYPPFCVHSTSPKTFERFSLNFTQMFLSVMRCAKPMTQLCRLKVALQCHGIYPLIYCPFPSPKQFASFSLTITQMFLSVSWLKNPKSKSHFKVIGDLRRGIWLSFRLLSCFIYFSTIKR